MFATFSDAVGLHNLLLILACAGGGLRQVWQTLAVQSLWDLGISGGFNRTTAYLVSEGFHLLPLSAYFSSL